jgi:hypothetical protein
MDKETFTYSEFLHIIEETFKSTQKHNKAGKNL